MDLRLPSFFLLNIEIIYGYNNFIFPKLDKGGGVGINAGELENFSKINKRGGAIIRYSRVDANSIGIRADGSQFLVSLRRLYSFWT